MFAHFSVLKHYINIYGLLETFPICVNFSTMDEVHAYILVRAPELFIMYAFRLMVNPHAKVKRTVVLFFLFLCSSTTSNLNFLQESLGLSIKDSEAFTIFIKRSKENVLQPSCCVNRNLVVYKIVPSFSTSYESSETTISLSLIPLKALLIFQK